jgi:propionate CoA-transferase
MAKNKLMNVRDAVNLIQDGSCIAIASAGLVGYPEYLVKALEQRYLETQHPGNLMLVAGCGHGAFDERADSRFGHPGMVKRYIGSHPDTVPQLRKFIESNDIEGYVFPQGVHNQLYRVAAARQPGLLSKIGIGTYIDPRLEGGKLNEAAKAEDLVTLMEIDGEEWLYYRTFPVDVALLRATTADENGNLTCEHEALKLEILEIALAAKARGGLVIAQVERTTTNGSLYARDVVVSGQLVDYVVVTEDVSLDHRQTMNTIYSPYLSGELKRPASGADVPPEVMKADDIICRRACLELYPDAVVNIGVGIGAGVGSVASYEGILDKIMFTLELGTFGGQPTPLSDFGASYNAEAYVSQPTMFDFYHGGGLDVTFLGTAQVDKDGNVNVSKFGGRAAGQGGFIDISQTARKVVFVTYFKAKGLKTTVADGRICIDEEGQVPKFVDKAEQITFNGKLAAAQEGKEVYYVTERGVFKLTKDGVALIEIAPGIDLEKDILAQMGFQPIIAADLKIMDERIFIPGRMGYFDNVAQGGNVQ